MSERRTPDHNNDGHLNTYDQLEEILDILDDDSERKTPDRNKDGHINTWDQLEEIIDRLVNGGGGGSGKRSDISVVGELLLINSNIGYADQTNTDDCITIQLYAAVGSAVIGSAVVG